MYENLIEEKIGSEEIFNGRLLHVFRDTVSLPNGESSTREFIKHNGAVAVVPFFDDGTVLMERQFRYPHNRVVLEIPAGKIDPGEDILVAANRELREETGLINAELMPIGEIIPTVAYSTEVIYLFIAKNMTDSGKTDMDDNEFLETEKIHIDTLFNMIMNNEITDSKSQVAIMKTYFLYHEGKI